MNFPAPLAVVGFLAAVGALVLSVLAALTLLLAGKGRWLRRLGICSGTGAMVYFGLLFAFSLASREKTLEPGQEKYFCEIDCHLAYSVVRSREELKSGERQLRITVRTRFDENSISPQRPKSAPLSPNPRRVVLTDRLGHTLAPISVNGTPFVSSLIPGESYETEFIFQPTGDVAALHLLIANPEWEEHFLIGDENSFGHQKTYLAIPAANAVNRN